MTMLLKVLTAVLWVVVLVFGTQLTMDLQGLGHTTMASIIAFCTFVVLGYPIARRKKRAMGVADAKR